MQKKSLPTPSNSPHPSLLIAGLGKIGLKLARKLSQDFQVVGIKRSKPEQSENFPLIIADLLDKNVLEAALIQSIPEGVDYLLICLTPTERNESAYRQIYLEGVKNLMTCLPGFKRLKHLFFVSSTSVYHQDDSHWVNEESICKPSNYSGRVLVEAEAQIQSQAPNSSIIRFSGIYGGHRRQLIEQVKKSASEHTPILSAESHLTNRIHEDDCINFLAHLIRIAKEGKPLEPIYLASDSAPIELNEVIHYIASQHQLNIPSVPVSHKARRSGNKKCNNSKMLASGYALKHPSYQSGYRVCESEND